MPRRTTSSRTRPPRSPSRPAITCFALFRLFRGLARTRTTRRIVLFIGLGDALERGLVGILIDLGLVAHLLAALVGLPPAAHLRLR
ncbi:hypothetical protein XH88_07365 [Bradyrhizobium sp. CCBAU 51627]|nr:hypothetical protein [Bradyrhizobium sp. CCBAU 51627]